MLKEERLAHILRQVNIHNKVLSSHLSESMQVSEDTIRRDLAELAHDGKIIKVHGGAISNSFHLGIASNDVYLVDDKKNIAIKALELIQDGMFVLTTGGTTIIELAKMIPDDLHATFITVSLPAAFEYANHPNIEVIMIGDKISNGSKIAVGAEAILRLQSIRADICFLGINAISINDGLTDNDWDVVQVKKTLIKRARKVVALSISEKVDTAEQLKICDVDDIDILITELPPEHPKLQPYKSKGLQIL